MSDNEEVALSNPLIEENRAKENLLKAMVRSIPTLRLKDLSVAEDWKGGQAAVTTVSIASSIGNIDANVAGALENYFKSMGLKAEMVLGKLGGASITFRNAGIDDLIKLDAEAFTELSRRPSASAKIG